MVGIQNTRGNIIIHFYIYKKQLPARRLITDHVAPCSCRLLLETAPARLLPALEARPLLQRTRRTQPGAQGKKIPCPIRPPVIFTDHEINPNAESFAAFQIEMTSPGFQEELEKARDNPKSKEAGKLIQRLKRFITMSGVKILRPSATRSTRPT